MDVTFKKNNQSVTKHYNLSDKEMEIMKFLYKHKRINFPEKKYGDGNPKDETGTFYYKDCIDLNGVFIKEDSDSYYTFVCTQLGQYFLNDNLTLSEHVHKQDKKESWTSEIEIWKTLFELKEDDGTLGLKGTIFFAKDFAKDVSSGELQTIISYPSFNGMNVGSGICSYIVTNDILKEKFMPISKTFLEFEKEVQQNQNWNENDE